MSFRLFAEPIFNVGSSQLIRPISKYEQGNLWQHAQFTSNPTLGNYLLAEEASGERYPTYTPFSRSIEKSLDIQSLRAQYSGEDIHSLKYWSHEFDFTKLVDLAPYTDISEFFWWQSRLAYPSRGVMVYTGSKWDLSANTFFARARNDEALTAIDLRIGSFHGMQADKNVNKLLAFLLSSQYSQMNVLTPKQLDGLYNSMIQGRILNFEMLRYGFLHLVSVKTIEEEIKPNFIGGFDLEAMFDNASIWLTLLAAYMPANRRTKTGNSKAFFPYPTDIHHEDLYPHPKFLPYMFEGLLLYLVDLPLIVEQQGFNMDFMSTKLRTSLELSQKILKAHKHLLTKTEDKEIRQSIVAHGEKLSEIIRYYKTEKNLIRQEVRAGQRVKRRQRLIDELQSYFARNVDDTSLQRLETNFKDTNILDMDAD